MQNHSYENDFDFHENETACRTHFHMKGFALRLVLKQRHENSEMAYCTCCAQSDLGSYCCKNMLDILWPVVQVSILNNA